MRFDEPNTSTLHGGRAPCINASCLLETSIRLLLDVKAADATSQCILEQEPSRIQDLSDAEMFNYLNFPLSKAVDGRQDTAFRSPGCEYMTVSP